MSTFEEINKQKPENFPTKEELIEIYSELNKLREESRLPRTYPTLKLRKTAWPRSLADIYSPMPFVDGMTFEAKLYKIIDVGIPQKGAYYLSSHGVIKLSQSNSKNIGMTRIIVCPL